jgi:hypothetical protein
MAYMWAQSSSQLLSKPAMQMGFKAKYPLPTLVLAPLRTQNMTVTRLLFLNDEHDFSLPVPSPRFLAETGSGIGTGLGIFFRFPSILFPGGIAVSLHKNIL